MPSATSVSPGPSASVSSGSGDEINKSDRDRQWALQEQEEWAVYDREWAAHRLILCVVGQEEIGEHIQNKRDQWKAASARYYERHPEVKEKKRIQAAEKRAAKKLARRRWDPPKQRKPVAQAREQDDAPGCGVRDGQEAAELLLGLRDVGPPRRFECPEPRARGDAWALLAPQYDSED
ncbi:hypothetical protein K438DRAFT_1993536 [Mycena galopus ATCC 62051]|nr:hypothetical protein K438DRAFT_1993536 [Mycena galopus ATCC 62051]